MVLKNMKKCNHEYDIIISCLAFTKNYSKLNRYRNIMLRKIPVLLYHNVAHESADKWTITSEHFESILIYFKKYGFDTISCRELIDLRDTFVPKKVSIAFDDGHQGIYTEAFPLLKKYGFIATIFLTTSFINKCEDSFAGLTSGQIREMADYGIEIGSHGVTHVNLRKLSLQEQTMEIVNSKDFMENTFNIGINTFSYPHGCYDDNLKRIITRAGYTSAFSVFKGYSTRSFDQYAYDRLETSNCSHPLRGLEFRIKTNGYYLF
ncbi:MAG: hypothetical protein DKM50_04640 [Candidatus Margulisiibacteriota bacterium]|nr:MAG: hypothetical protein DKM50_04640 [Candidatus Margulisiibacteriota bacterium]